MKTFFSHLGREVKGYFSYPLAYLLLLAFIVVSAAHLEPSVSPFSVYFGEMRGWLAGWFTAPFWGDWKPIVFTLSAYLLCILPGILLLLLVLSRCFADDALPLEQQAVSLSARPFALAGKFIGTLFVAALLWAPALGAAYQLKWLEPYKLNYVLMEVGALAVLAAFARTVWTRGFRTLFFREVRASFYSPIAYVVMCFILVATGFDFFSGVSFLNQGPTEVTVVEAAFNTVLFWIPTLLIFPLITMRTYSDELRMGTFETVTTAPVRDWEVVASKFAGALFFYCILWLPSALYFISFQLITGKQAAMAAGAYGGSYLLLFLIGMFYISIGCLCSSLTREQINAAVMSFVIIFAAFAMGLIGMIMNISAPEVQEMIAYFSAVQHMSDFSRGLIDSRPIVFYLSMTALVLYINFQVFQFRKWKA
jgi:ABC-2 type transport system permease protein